MPIDIAATPTPEHQLELGLGFNEDSNFGKLYTAHTIMDTVCCIHKG